ncbi:conserved oligomeric golgi complex component 4 [Fusarium beomiforme]|uniref:Conserved oligomeric Golgi complex subunit 4 n=1 Tax=Fusarium beomiforme TaxID=44412 RepID=A0A9P5AVA4_9HYPO|nr:conserved oligomeric golgi complex component 4 [Fusarium beomiforme]
MAKINDIFRSASSESDVRKALDLLHEREDSLMFKLDSPVKNSKDLNRDLDCLGGFRGDLDMKLIVAQNIQNTMLSSAVSTAERLSAMIRALEMEKARVEATLVVIEQVAELKACIAGLIGSMGAPQDWEAAAGYLMRAADIPEEVIRGDFSLAVEPSMEMPEPPWTTIRRARKSLCTIFLREFNATVEQVDGIKIARFFKLFPIIGEDEVGLDAYARYVCQGMTEAAGSALKMPHRDRGGMFHAKALTKLFEHIVQIIDSHSGLIERHYGSGKVIKVIERLQAEVDIQGGIILDMWSDEKAAASTMAHIKSYAFTFLLKSMMPAQKGLGLVLRGRGPNEVGLDLDVKKVEGLFAEMSAMMKSWSPYKRFIASKCKGVLSQDTLSLPRVLHQCNLQTKISETLIEPYKTTATFLFRKSVEKAFEIDTAPSNLSLSKPCKGSPPFILQVVDDLIEVVVSITMAVGRVLESDFIGIIHRRMEESYPKPLVQDRFPAEDRIISFMVLINTLDMAKEYLDRIIRSKVSSVTQRTDMAGPFLQTLKDPFPFDRDAELVTNTLQSLNSGVSAKATELMNDGIRALLDEVLWPRIRPILINSFQDAHYDVLEEELLDEEEEDGETVQRVSVRFESEWLALTRPTEAYHDAENICNFEAFAQADYTFREPFAWLKEILVIASMDDHEWDELISGQSGQGIDWLLSDEDMAKARNIARK